MSKTEKMLTVSEAAKRLGTAESSVRLWTRQRKFAGAERKQTPFGHYWLIPESSLVGFQPSKPGPKPKPKSAGSGKTKARKRGKG